MTALLFQRLAEGAALADASLWDGLRRDVLDALRPAAIAAGSLATTVSDLLLFTIMGVAISGDHGAVFAAGDGVAAICGRAETGPCKWLPSIRRL